MWPDPVLPRSYPPAVWRLIHSPFSSGALNMAVDEAILLSVAEGQVSPTLRLYGWAPPCLSLGYAQPLADVDADRLREHGWECVRRPTGGRAILHTDELTYSIIAPMDEPRVVGGVVESYRQLSTGLLRGLERLGLHTRAERKTPTAAVEAAQLPVCFEVPSDYEITANGKKLLGSAQVRKRGVVLQHGTLPLTGDIARIADGLRFVSAAERERVKTRIHERAATVAEVGGRAVSWVEAAQALADGLAERLNLEWAEAALTEAENERASQLRIEKYATADWNGRV